MKKYNLKLKTRKKKLKLQEILERKNFINKKQNNGKENWLPKDLLFSNKSPEINIKKDTFQLKF